MGNGADLAGDEWPDANRELAKAIMNLSSPADWEDIAPAYRKMWREKARLVQDRLATVGHYITSPK